MCAHSTAPGVPPEIINVSTVNPSIIHVSWGEVPCPQRNGEITGYIVEYSRRGGGMQTRVNVSRDEGSTSITGLDPFTEYIIRVAAVNSIGTGPFSDPVNVTTEPLCQPL